MVQDNTFSVDSGMYRSARPAYPPDLYSYLASITPNLHRAWDCATGNGQAALGLANHFERIEASDISPEQIRHAFPHPRITYHIHPAEVSPYPSGHFDLVVVAQALHWFSLDTFFAEVHRVLKPYGVFAAWGYSFFTINPEIDNVVSSAVLDPISSFWSPQNRLLWEGYQTIPFPVVETPTPSFEMSFQWTLSDLMAYMETWSAWKRCLEQNGDAFFQKAIIQLHKVWGDDAFARKVTMKFFLRAGIHSPEL